MPRNSRRPWPCSRRAARLWALHRLRKDEGTIFEHREESFRLHPRLDEQAILESIHARYYNGFKPRVASSLRRVTHDVKNVREPSFPSPARMRRHSGVRSRMARTTLQDARLTSHMTPENQKAFGLGLWLSGKAKDPIIFPPSSAPRGKNPSRSSTSRLRTFAPWEQASCSKCGSRV